MEKNSDKIRVPLKTLIWKYDREERGGLGRGYVDVELVDRIVDFIEQEIDRAREDGIREALEEINRTLGTNIKYVNGEYRVVFRRVSKLKDNK